MKLRYASRYVGLLLTGALYFGAATTHRPSSAELPQRRIQQGYERHLEAFGVSLAQLHRAATDLEAQPDQVETVRAALLAARLRYKRLEFLLDYLDPEAAQRYLNGPPLPELEPNAPSLSILEPQGLQVLDELLFGEGVDPAAIAAQTQALQASFREIASFQRHVPLSDRQVFEAVRFELVRIFSLGLTGFDTPASQHAIPEAEVALASLHEALSLYFPQLPAPLRQALDQTFEEAIAYLQQHRDFETLDRLHVLVTYINPLFQKTLEAQLALGIETIYETRPAHWKSPINYLADNLFAPDFLNANYYAAVTDTNAALVSLGRLLFFDPVLSGNNQRSCASCHRPERAFTDGEAKSIALDFAGTVTRNAPTLLNAAYADRFFYDLRAEDLENQFEHVVTGPKEFHTRLFDLVEKLRRSSEYRALFQEAFPALGANSLSTYTLGAALSAYVRSLSSFNSPFDRYVRHESAQLPPAAKRGFNLFMGKAACGTCHFAPTFAGLVPPFCEESESEVLGVPASADRQQPRLDPDPGRFAARPKENAPFFLHSFKTPTVRNVGLTAPYMHNGVYATLDEVIDFYDVGGGTGLGLDVPNQTLAGESLHLTTREKQDLLAFMQALTDTLGHTQTPTRLPAFPDPALADRKVGGVY